LAGDEADQRGGNRVSIVRIGLAETKNFSDGYDAIFGKRKPASKKAVSKSNAGRVKKKGTKKK
jgi:hypothetical protein